MWRAGHARAGVDCVWVAVGIYHHLDQYSRAIVGWRMRERMDGKLVMDASSMALERYGALPAILHSGQSSLYAMTAYCDYQTLEEARASAFEYTKVFYNRQRRHSSLHYASPLEFETMQSTP